jgi:gas vesicle protein
MPNMKNSKNGAPANNSHKGKGNQSIPLSTFFLLNAFGDRTTTKESAMRSFETRNRLKDWFNVALKVGILLTEPKFRDAVASRAKDRMNVVTDRVKDRVDDVSEIVTEKYEDALDRLHAAAEALQGRHRTSPVFGFLLGAGIGAGFGILLAPAAGRETREAIRTRAVDAKDKIAESACVVIGRFRQSTPQMPSAGTEG